MVFFNKGCALIAEPTTNESTQFLAKQKQHQSENSLIIVCATGGICHSMGGNLNCLSLIPYFAIMKTYSVLKRIMFGSRLLSFSRQTHRLLRTRDKSP